MEASIPETILAEVADTRVLALDIATKEVRQKLKAWCENNKKEADAMSASFFILINSRSNLYQQKLARAISLRGGLRQR